MSVFDDLKESVKASLSEWIKINDPLSKWTLESFEKENYDEEKIKPHCMHCVIINHCWFKNEKGKKPDEFDYSKYTTSDVAYSSRGLYHPNCHDQKIPIDSPRPRQIRIFDLERRMDYLINKKMGWLKAMGYNENDIREVFQLIEKLSKESYCNGDYKNNPPPPEKTKYGFRVKVILNFPGKGEKFGRIYKITSSYIVYPDGKLKNNTPIGGWAK